MDDILLYFSYIFNGDWLKIYDSIKNKMPVDYKKLEDIKKSIKSKYVTILSSDYPEELKLIDCPPYVIYYQGNYDLLKTINKISVIGSRENTSYGEKMTNILVSDLVAKGYVIVSGSAKGIDSIAHQKALALNGGTIAIVAQGIDVVYPKENKTLYDSIVRNGLIISEYPDGSKPIKSNFPYRNRLIAALCKGILVVESKIKSGTMITVRYGLSYNKEVFCVPNVANVDSGCNLLIKQGAKLTEKVSDILEEFL
ncbi:MAG: DNA-processing protein DprA [Bacilli bacterium]|nr:DNA-processing protein DprA [Bacilli bacterium]